MNKDMKKLVAEAEKWGYEHRITKKGHITMWHDGKLIATFSGSASDRHSHRNALSFMKRHNGFQWPPRR